MAGKERLQESLRRLLAEVRADLELGVGVFGSCGRGKAGVGSEVNLTLVTSNTRDFRA